jgi:hypothetical protein
MPEMTFQTRREYNRPSGGLFHRHTRFDGAGTRHTVYVDHNGDADTTVIVYERAPRGASTITQVLTVQGLDARGQAWKFDDVSVCANRPDGATMYDVVVSADWHGAKVNSATAPGRVTGGGDYAFVGVYAPHQGLDAPNLDFDAGEHGEVIGGSTPPPDPTPTLTVEEIMVAMRREFGGSSNDIRQGLEDKTKDAVRELKLWSPSLQDRGLDQWDMDRLFQTFDHNVPGFWPWLRSRVPGAEAAFRAQEAAREAAELAAQAEEENK